MVRASQPASLTAIGVTLRQYDHWATQGWVDRGSRLGAPGGRLTFTPDQLVRLKLMAQMVNSLGINARRAAHLLDHNVMSHDDNGHTVFFIPPNITLEIEP